MTCRELFFSGHAVRRMFERGLTEVDVRKAIESGEVIASYLDDSPFPSYLVLGFAGAMPIHVVVAVNAATAGCTVVTVYKPDEAIWRPDYRTRR